ncbi:MAG: TonB-dependent receptor [Bacteroidia bacterium]
MKNTTCLCVWACLLPIFCFGQSSITISGYVSDQQNGEKLLRATVQSPDQKIGTYTNDFGFFSLSVPAGTMRLRVSYSGYEAQSIAFIAETDSFIEFKLQTQSLEAVEIRAERQIEEETEMSVVDIPLRQIKAMPTLLGEVDVIRAVQMMPGVQSGNEGNTGLYVRGGGPDQNLILLDGAPLYYVSHLGGIFSVFNADALQQVRLIKGGFPARYGGRLSSVLDIRMKDGNLKKWEGTGNVGLIASRLLLQGPLIKDKASIMISARRTYLDLLSRPATWFATERESSFGYYFADFNAKLNYIISPKDRIYLSTYIGDDVFGVKVRTENGTFGADDYEKESLDIDLSWGNRLYSFRWNHLWGPRLFSNLTVTHTFYRFALRNQASYQDSGTRSEADVSYNSGIRDIGLKYEFDFYPHPKHQIRFGVHANYLQYSPGIRGVYLGFNDTTAVDNNEGNEVLRPWQNAIYFEDEWRPNSNFSVHAGIRGVHYWIKQKSYFSVQPRLSLRYQAAPNLSLKASFAVMTQYLHLLTNSGLGVPSDLWVPATDEIGPQQAWQVAVGTASSLWDDKFNFTIEAYYKKMQGLISYEAGASPISGGIEWQEKVVTGGTGQAYGGEALLQKKYGNTTGWIGYTLSWNWRTFADLNRGQTFPYKYDRRHDASVVISHKFNERISLSGSWIFGTGNAITLATGAYNSLYSDYSPVNLIEIYGEGRNDFRMPAYHRMDIGINFSKPKKWGSRTWNISFYNAYSRRNPYFYYFDTTRSVIDNDWDNPITEIKLKQVSLFPILPSVSYGFSF